VDRITAWFPLWALLAAATVFLAPGAVFSVWRNLSGAALAS
jgi:hypothetical protein